MYLEADLQIRCRSVSKKSCEMQLLVILMLFNIYKCRTFFLYLHKFLNTLSVPGKCALTQGIRVITFWDD